MNSIFKVTVLYLIFGVLWIFCSDRLVAAIVSDNIIALSKFQTYKGLFFIALTAVLLNLLIRWYHKELTTKVAMLELSKAALSKSEENYRLLFDSNPTPILIYLPDTERIIEVNKAALEYYQYTVSEFSEMSILKIEDDEEIDTEALEEKLNISKREDMLHTEGIHRHRRKDGRQMFVYMHSGTITYRGLKAQIVMINDITHQLQYIDKVEEQNKKLNKIAWLQSHVVRAPLASLMGLVNLLKNDLCNKDEMQKVHEEIMASANELDRIIKNISASSTIQGAE
ncbi:MAG: PAS domain S-box protein [Flavipsychrobacter sp.]